MKKDGKTLFEYLSILLKNWKWKLLGRVRLFATPWTIYSPWNSPGQNSGLGSLSLLQGIFPTQGLNPGLPHCGRILYQLSHFTKRYIIYSIYSYNQLIHMNNSSTLRILGKYIHNFLQNYLKINTSVIQVLLAWNLIDLIIANTGIFVQVWRRTLMEILFKCD